MTCFSRACTGFYTSRQLVLLGAESFVLSTVRAAAGRGPLLCTGKRAPVPTRATPAWSSARCVSFAVVALLVLCSATVFVAGDASSSGVQHRRSLRRALLQISRETEQTDSGSFDYPPGSSGNEPTFWLLRRFHRGRAVQSSTPA